MRKLKLNLGLILPLLVALALPAGLGARLWLLDLRAAPSGAEVAVEIPKGAGVMQVGEILEKTGVVRSAWGFALASRLTTLGPLKAGEYGLSPAMSQRAILNHLARGRVLLHSVTIPEGFSLTQVVARLAEARLLDPALALELARDREFVTSLGLKGDSLEGYLFPDTYRLPRGLGARAVLTLLARRFQAEWKALEPLAAKGGLGQRQAVILASIIEREARVDEERPVISAVYHNRLKLGMKLQADPTVIYGLGDFEGNLTRVHLEKDHAYNTYTREGLPPGPICSPGLASLKAALRPAAVDYLYFVAKGDGSHAFSRAYQDQINNINRYQRRRNGG